ncbi:hypothetical protein ACJJTC_010948 [Scirpophaga incertulas]
MRREQRKKSHALLINGMFANSSLFFTNKNDKNTSRFSKEPPPPTLSNLTFITYILVLRAGSYFIAVGTPKPVSQKGNSHHVFLYYQDTSRNSYDCRTRSRRRERSCSARETSIRGSSEGTYANHKLTDIEEPKQV